MAASFYVIDGHANCYRAFYATQRSPLAAPDGFPTGTIQVLLNMVQRLIREQRPDYLAIAFDAPGKTFRHERYPRYKERRKPTPDELRDQIPLIQQICRACRIPVVSRAPYEADDLMGTLARRAADAGLQAVLVTSDNDALQLVADGRVSVYDPVKDIEYDEARVEQEKGLPPSRLTELMALTGDASDNIPGVPGVGPKRALALLKKYGALEAVLEAAPYQSPSLRKNLFEHQADALLSRELATIKTDVPLDFQLEEARRRPPDLEALVPLLERLGLAQQFRSLTGRRPSSRRETYGEPVVLGLVGSVCSGKSMVSAELERLGARVHRADAYVHKLLEQPEVIAEVVAALGEEILAEDSRIDRKKLGALVFSDPAKLEALEGILHPRTGRRARELIAELRRRRAAPVLVLDAPLLIEAGRAGELDRLLVVDAPRERREAWAAEHRGWDADELARREARLIPIDEKKRMARHVIENTGTKDDLLAKVRQVWKELV